MISLLKSLFLTTDRASANIEMVGKGLDSIVHTQEEKAGLLLAWVKATGPTNVSRRALAFAVAGVWIAYQLLQLILFLIQGGLTLFGDPSKNLAGLQAAVSTHFDATISGAFMLVMVFYFAPHALAAMKSSFITKALQGKEK